MVISEGLAWMVGTVVGLVADVLSSLGIERFAERDEVKPHGRNFTPPRRGGRNPASSRAGSRGSYGLGHLGTGVFK